MKSLLAAAALAWAGGPPESALSGPLQAEIERLEFSAKRSAVFRQLLAESDGTPRKAAALPAPSFVRYDPPPLGRLAFDALRLKAATEWEFQLAQARELARASMGLPIAVYEAELTAYLRELAFAVELAQADPAFAKAWLERLRKAKAGLDAATRSGQPSGSATAGEFDRLAFMGALLADGPDRFYAGAESALSWPAGMVKLAEIEDFLALHGPELKSLKIGEEDATVVAGGRRYRAAVARAAQAALPWGGADRVKEAVGPFEDRARQLSAETRRWLKAGLK